MSGFDCTPNERLFQLRLHYAFSELFEAQQNFYLPHLTLTSPGRKVLRVISRPPSNIYCSVLLNPSHSTSNVVLDWHQYPNPCTLPITRAAEMLGSTTSPSATQITGTSALRILHSTQTYHASLQSPRTDKETWLQWIPTLMSPQTRLRHLPSPTL